MHATQKIEPRVFDDDSGGIYIGKSRSWIRNARSDDQKRIADGMPPKGPTGVKIGRLIRYYREDLDAWLDSFKSATFSLTIQRLATLSVARIAFPPLR